MAKKVRVDLLLVERGLAESRSQAQRLVMAGQVRADGQVVLKPSVTLAEEAELHVDQGPPYVSRGGEKLAFALQELSVSVEGKICADVGASTGGFTDCLLQHGAAKVYAIDVGKGILHWRLRQDRRVIVLEQTNARYLEQLPEPVELITIDASFISLKLLLPVVNGWFGLTPGSSEVSGGQKTSYSNEGAGKAIALIKPQFEAGRQQVARGDGVVRDPAVHRQVLLDVLAFAEQSGYSVAGLLRSPLLGPKGNVEFLTLLEYPGGAPTDMQRLVDGALAAMPEEIPDA